VFGGGAATGSTFGAPAASSPGFGAFGAPKPAFGAPGACMVFAYALRVCLNGRGMWYV